MIPGNFHKRLSFARTMDRRRTRRLRPPDLRLHVSSSPEPKTSPDSPPFVFPPSFRPSGGQTERILGPAVSSLAIHDSGGYVETAEDLSIAADDGPGTLQALPMDMGMPRRKRTRLETFGQGCAEADAIETDPVNRPGRDVGEDNIHGDLRPHIGSACPACGNVPGKNLEQTFDKLAVMSERLRWLRKAQMAATTGVMADKG